MKKLSPLLLILLIGCNQSEKINSSRFDYPEAPMQIVSEKYFGKTIQDDYRNIENLKDTLVQKWFKEESEFAKRIFWNITGKAELIEKMKMYDQRVSFEVWKVYVTGNDQYFFLKQGADEDVARLFYRESFSSKDELLFDPKNFKIETGNTYVINYIKPSWNGDYIAVSLSHNGEEVSEIIFIDMRNRKVLPQIIDHCWPTGIGGISWLPDNSGILYVHLPEIDHTSENFLKNTMSVFYKIGDDPKKLNVLLSRETHPELNLRSEDFPIVMCQSEEDQYLYVNIGGATAYHDGYYGLLKNIQKGNLEWQPLHKKADKVEKIIFEDTTFICLSALNSSNFQVLSSLLRDPDIKNATVLVDEKHDEVIRDIKQTSNCLYYTSTKNGVEGKLYSLNDGKENEIVLPNPSGRINIFNKGTNYPELWVSTIGWINDYNRYQYNFTKNTFIEENLEPKTFFPEFDDFVLKELLVSSYDGEKVPLSVIHKKNISLNGQHPTMIYGYGSYGHSIRPYFNPKWLTWVEEGGILCIAHVRGGGEKGDNWYQEGKKITKPNTWKDLIACTEFMIKEGYTSKNKTVIRGGSAGGILIGRALTERPDLFAVAIAEVGMMNPLRNEETPNGPNNAKEFGTIKDSTECMALIEMDAYLHIKMNTDYPATLITTGMNDPRVIAWQPGKFAAKLQANNISDKPIIFSVNYKSGHGLNDTKSIYYEQLANVYSFAFWQTGHLKYSLKEKAFH